MRQRIGKDRWLEDWKLRWLAEVRSQKTEVRRQRVGGFEAEDRGQRAEDRKLNNTVIPAGF